MAGQGPGPCPSLSSSPDRHEAAGRGGGGLPPAHCSSPSQGSCWILHTSHTPRAWSQPQPGGESQVQGRRPVGAPAGRPAPNQTAAYCPHPAVRSPQDTPTAQSGQGAVPSGDLGAGGAGLCSLGTPDLALPRGVGSSRQGPQPPQPRATWPQLSVQHRLPTPTVGPAALESLPRPRQAKGPASPVVCLRGHHTRGKHSPPTLGLTEAPRGEVVPDGQQSSRRPAPNLLLAGGLPPPGAACPGCGRGKAPWGHRDTLSLPGEGPRGSLLCGQASQHRGLGGGVGGAPPGPSPPRPPPLAPGASQSGSPTHPAPPNLRPHRTPGCPVSAFTQASYGHGGGTGAGVLVRAWEGVPRPRVSSANTDQLWAWLLLPASSCSHPIKALPQVPSGTSCVVLRDPPLRGRCLHPPHRQPRARPWGGALGVLQAAGESVWRPPAWGCPACLPRPWPGTAARGCPAAWGSSSLGQGLLGWRGERLSLSQSSSFPRAGPAAADHSTAASCSHSREDRWLWSRKARAPAGKTPQAGARSLRTTGSSGRDSIPCSNFIQTDARASGTEAPGGPEPGSAASLGLSLTLPPGRGHLLCSAA